jgi:methionyl aminopeptidase
MIRLKSKQEIEILREGGQLLAAILKRTAALVRPGVSTAELNQYAENEIAKIKGRPAFKNYQVPGLFPYPAGLCTSLNNVIVHGIPSERVILKEGDIISLDIGMEYKNLYTDMAMTVAVGKVSAAVEKLIKVTRESLYLGIDAIKPGGTLADIGRAVQAHAEKHHYGVVRDLVGHGVGYEVHEAPQVPNYLTSAAQKIKLEPGLVIAIEPMLTMGDYETVTLNDGWAIATRDNSLSAHWEHTIAVTEDGLIIITEE